MGKDISKGNLTDSEIKAGYTLENDGAYAILRNWHLSNQPLKKWWSSTPNMQPEVRNWFRQMEQSRQKIMEELSRNINDEGKAVHDYKYAAIQARASFKDSLAKTYEDIARQEEDHHNRLVKLYNQILKGEL